jgi:hypothetical protein
MEQEQFMDRTLPITIYEKATAIPMIATRDHDVIRTWATRLGAEPATGEHTASGPATIDIQDGGSGLRFNFPAAGRFRVISWGEWFEHFDRQNLMFVFANPQERDVASRAYEIWERRGGAEGHELDDWFQAEDQLRGDRAVPEGDSRYRLIKHDDAHLK